jgi:NADPH:quinone reductase-like Zn-dependent oxidoreductase
MRAVVIEREGPPETLKLVERDTPSPAADDLLIHVRSVGVNRADCLQRDGTYPTPPGVRWSDIPGLELAGEVVATGEAVTGFSPGDRVFGLVAGGAYAEMALLDHRLALKIPNDMDFVTAAGIIEVFATANETVFELGQLKPGETLLVHAGASGVGSTAVQMAKQRGCTVLATAGSDTKVARLMELGADAAINYRVDDFTEAALRHTDGKGVDVIEDFIGANYLMRNLSSSMRGDWCWWG